MDNNTLTRAYFNEKAAHWNQKVSPGEEKILNLLSQINFHRTGSILDVGCGTGILFPILQQLTNGDTRIFGIDFADCMIQQAAAYQHPSIHVLCSDVLSLPFPGNCFDKIIAFHMFPHVNQKSEALSECWRVLIPGGELVIIHLHSSAEMNSFHESLGEPVCHHKLPNGEQMADLLKKNKFEVIDNIDIPGNYFVTAVKEHSFAN